MNQDKIVRKHLLDLLDGDQAHMRLDEAVKEYPIKMANTKFPNGEYSSWHLLEHIRRTQKDILEFITSSNYQEKDWPKDYWPDKDEKTTEKDWNKTIEQFKKDIIALKKIVSDPKTDLYAKIPWGEGQTIFREILLTADHSAYHIGEFAIMRQVMNTWNR